MSDEEFFDIDGRGDEDDELLMLINHELSDNDRQSLIESRWEDEDDE